jgi:hypothetical protein
MVYQHFSHLATGLEVCQHRPLDGIVEPEQRAAAASLRTWFAREFFDGLMD